MPPMPCMGSEPQKLLFGRNSVFFTLEHKPVQMALVVKPVILLYIPLLYFFTGFVFGMQVWIPGIPVVMTGRKTDYKQKTKEYALHESPGFWVKITKIYQRKVSIRSGEFKAHLIKRKGRIFFREQAIEIKKEHIIQAIVITRERRLAQGLIGRFIIKTPGRS
jgi:hypothetical protein